MYSRKMLLKALSITTLFLLFISTYPVIASSFNQLNDVDVLPIGETILDETYLASNQFTQVDDLRTVDNLLTVPDTYILVGETDSLLLYMEEGSYAIRVVNKVDGFIHGSSFGKTGDNYSYLGTTWEENVNSAVVLSYYIYNDENGEYTIVEESFLSSEDSTSTYELVDDGFSARLHFGRSGIELTLNVHLVGDYLSVEIPNASITENQYQLRSVKVYQFMGAVFEDSVPGYIFVPDGSGALIRYQALNVHTDTYNFQYYGNDDSLTPMVDNEPSLAFPITGVIQGINQHGFVTIVEDGAPFANFSVSPAKNTLRFYFSYNEFRYRSLYQTPRSESQANSQTGTQVTQDEMNSCNVVIKYRFLAGNEANYVGMANIYKDYLLSTNRLDDSEFSASKSSVLIEVIGTEKKSGFIFNETLAMTTMNELSLMIQELNESIDFIKIIYKGFTKGGATSSGLNYSKKDPSLGTKSDYEYLMKTVSETNSNIYFYLDVAKVYEDGSFNLYKDIAQRVNQNLLQGNGLTKSYYYVSPKTIKLQYLENMKRLQNQEITTYAIDTVGYKLYSDFKDKANEIDRSEMIEIVKSMFEEHESSNVLYRPNDYLLKYSDYYLSMPMTSSRYRIYSDTVPFMSYVLSGIMESYSPFQNFSSSSKIDILKMVDYNINPSYVISEKSAYLLQDTELGQIYSSSYSTWKEAIINQYQFVSSSLNEVKGSSVISRIALQPGFYLVTYDNGVQIYINYTNETLTDNLESVTARNYKVVLSDD